MASLHQTEGFSCIAAYMECLAVELADEGVERAHNVADGAIAVISRVRSRRIIGLFEYGRIGLFHHLLTIVNADQILLEDIVVEHVFRCLTQINNPFSEGWRFDAVGHVLGID